MAPLVARAQQASQATLGRKVNKDQPPSLQDQGVRRDALDCQESLAWKESRARQDPKVIGKLFFSTTQTDMAESLDRNVFESRNDV